MLNPFPQLLVFGFFAPTLLRIAAALTFAYVAYYHLQHARAIKHERFPVIGANGWVVWVAVVVEIAVALGLFFGYYTQIAALLGVLMGLKYAVWAGKYPSYFCISRAAALLIAAICLSLLISGAGALAFDLPL